MRGSTAHTIKKGIQLILGRVQSVKFQKNMSIGKRKKKRERELTGRQLLKKWYIC